MFVVLIKYLVCGMMLTHSLLGCHAHHVADACCSAAFGQMRYLLVSSPKSEAEVRPAIACGCGHAHSQANNDTTDTPDAPSGPAKSCCAEHECVYLADGATPALIDLGESFATLLASVDLLEMGVEHFSSRVGFFSEACSSSAQLRAQTQVWLI